jgi:hypothetical protein
MAASGAIGGAVFGEAAQVHDDDVVGCFCLAVGLGVDPAKVQAAMDPAKVQAGGGKAEEPSHSAPSY